MPDTQDSIISGCLSNAFSTSRQEIFSPPLIINAFFLSRINKYPSSSRYPRSPVFNQPFTIVFLVSSSFFRYPIVFEGDLKTISPTALVFKKLLLSSIMPISVISGTTNPALFGLFK